MDYLCIFLMIFLYLINIVSKKMCSVEIDDEHDLASAFVLRLISNLKSTLKMFSNMYTKITLINKVNYIKKNI